MTLKEDCMFFKGDRPCDPHKEKGVKCNDCTFYQPINFKILIIKLDAVGDVLRTTSILKPLKQKFPKSYIEWCTRKNSIELFKNNPFVDEVMSFEDDATFRINAEDYELVINLDTSKLSSAIATTAKSKKNFGFVLNKKGFVEATSDSAQRWLEMSAFDDVKKANAKSYQQIMYEILELDLPIQRPMVEIPQSVKNKILKKDYTQKINSKKLTIGLNIGVGTKWPSKGWSLEKWSELITQLGNKDYNLLVLGGPEEVNSVNIISKEFNYVIDSGCDNTLLEFAEIVNLCDLVITADTLALHLATALEKKIIALFGPTSENEIELYGKGIKLSSSEGCKCYYRKYCSEGVSCMEKITSKMVIEAIDSIIE